MKTLSTAKKTAGLWDTVRTVLYALLIALGIRTLAYEPFNIPSGSMIPTLLIGDYLFVSKFSYGYSRYSLPFGLPGDRIQMIHGILNINGEPVKRERIEDFVEGEGRTALRYTQYMETLPNGRKHRIIKLSDDSPLDNTQVYVVPAGNYFAMGDNRDNSLDSRVLSGVGYVPAVNLVGRAEFLFYSTSGEARFWEIWKWPLATRFTRMFHGID